MIFSQTAAGLLGGEAEHSGASVHLNIYQQIRFQFSCTEHVKLQRISELIFGEPEVVGLLLEAFSNVQDKRDNSALSVRPDDLFS